MKTSLARYGQKMGILRSDLRVDTRYRISPSETKALKGYWGHMVPNTLWRFRSNIFYMLPRKFLLFLSLYLSIKNIFVHKFSSFANYLIFLFQLLLVVTWLSIMQTRHMKDYQENNLGTLMIKSMCKELKIEYIYLEI